MGFLFACGMLGSLGGPLFWVLLYVVVWVGCVLCIVPVVTWDSWLFSPMMEVGLFQSRIDGEGGGGEIVECGLCK